MHLPPLIQDLAAILGVAAIVTFLFRLLKQPVVLGYVVAGVIVGPHTPPIVSVLDVESVKVWAELGVIFLMFALGLEFSFRRLAKVGVSAGATAMVQIVTMLAGGYLLGRFLNWSAMDALFLGAMISISSTTIIIKALEELGLKTRRFAELVFGILIVEDLAAIVLLVALASIASKSAVSGLDLLAAGGKLGLVVGAWLVIGMFVVPRVVKAVGRKGNDEMLVVVALGLCLALVSLSAYFHYSAALGAFIMGSILAETREAHRIEVLLTPLKDIFGAVFFVSVGMLLDPHVLAANWGATLAICAVIIVGKTLSVAAGALLTGQSLGTATHAGLSMAQIGEFSFIIATLGMSYGAISPQLYPIIVAASLITTFTTPYSVKAAPAALALLERRLPRVAKDALERYERWFQVNTPSRYLDRSFYQRLLRAIANAIVVITLFVVAAEKLAPWLGARIADGRAAAAAAWCLAFLASAPFIWAMLTSFRGAGLVSLGSKVATVLTIGVVSVEFFSVWLALALTVSGTALVFVMFRRHIEAYYDWFERTFVRGISRPPHAGHSAAPRAEHLVPWQAHLARVTVGARSPAVGQTLRDLRLPERFGMNVVVLSRDGRSIVAPRADERLLPGDALLCFGTDEELEAFQREMSRASDEAPSPDLGAYELRPFEVRAASPIAGATLSGSRFREDFDCMVVGVERSGADGQPDRRIKNPKHDETFVAGDRIWLVGPSERLQKVAGRFRNAAN